MFGLQWVIRFRVHERYFQIYIGALGKVNISGNGVDIGRIKLTTAQPFWHKYFLIFSSSL